MLQATEFVRGISKLNKAIEGPLTMYAICGMLNLHGQPVETAVGQRMAVRSPAVHASLCGMPTDEPLWHPAPETRCQGAGPCVTVSGACVHAIQKALSPVRTLFEPG
jgi:hypothetical protein